MSVTQNIQAVQTAVTTARAAAPASMSSYEVPYVSTGVPAAAAGSYVASGNAGGYFASSNAGGWWGGWGGYNTPVVSEGGFAGGEAPLPPGPGGVLVPGKAPVACSVAALLQLCWTWRRACARYSACLKDVRAAAAVAALLQLCCSSVAALLQALKRQ